MSNALDAPFYSRSSHSWNIARAPLAIACFLLVLTVNGAIPFLTTPTLGQALWIDGFAQSYANDGLWTVYATYFGAPHPAAISFGLSGAWPVAVLLTLGIPPADAYTLVVAFWLAVAVFGAHRLARLLEASYHLAILAATAWACLPIVWWHSNYSMLSSGFALLPFYLWTLVQLTRAQQISATNLIARSALFLVACQISAFMDGYTFVMFFTGAGLALLADIWCRRTDLNWGRRILHIGVFATGFGLAYAAYTAFIGKHEFQVESLDFFRAFGLDISYVFVPTRGISWLADALHLSVLRSGAKHYGDASVWTTTFLLPLALMAAWKFFRARQRSAMLWCAAAMALFGFYFALGPSVNIDVYRSPTSGGDTSHMPATASSLATGSGWFSQHVPGLRNMRASYRWAGLGALGLWLIIVQSSPTTLRNTQRGGSIACIVLILTSIPNLIDRYQQTVQYRAKFADIDRELVRPLRSDVPADAKIAILPWGNDFMANYIAPSAGVRAFNIGGDKNLHVARQFWPNALGNSASNSIDSRLADRVVALLDAGDADAVILSNFNMLTGAHAWPPEPVYANTIREVVTELHAHPGLLFSPHKHFTTVTLSEEWAKGVSPEERKHLNQQFVCLPPNCLRSDFTKEAALTKVGMQTSAGVQTTGNAGYLLFGPYVTLAPGNYRLALEGNVRLAGDAYVELSINNGQTIRKKVPLPEHGGGSLLATEIHLDNESSGCEIRVFVNASSDITITAYTLSHQGQSN